MATDRYIQAVPHKAAEREETPRAADHRDRLPSRDGRLTAVRAWARRWLHRLEEGLARQGELCLEAGPSCEIHRYV